MESPEITGNNQKRLMQHDFAVSHAVQPNLGYPNTIFSRIENQNLRI